MPTCTLSCAKWGIASTTRSRTDPPGASPANDLNSLQRSCHIPLWECQTFFQSLGARMQAKLCRHSCRCDNPLRIRAREDSRATVQSGMLLVLYQDVWHTCCWHRQLLADLCNPVNHIELTAEPSSSGRAQQGLARRFLNLAPVAPTLDHHLAQDRLALNVAVASYADRILARLRVGAPPHLQKKLAVASAQSLCAA